MPGVDDDGFTLVDFSVPEREKPISHPAVDPPLCDKCQELELSFFDPTCPGCSDILLNPKTSISQIFAIMRQWVPQTQQNIDLLVKEILRRGAHVNDRDGLTDMTMLHYVAKSGAVGVGDDDIADHVVKVLLDRGADFSQKCRWTDMLPLHYATFFDVFLVVDTLLEASGNADIDRPCKEFDNGSPLHIACSNLCYKTAKALLKQGANPHLRNGLGKTPLECIQIESSTEDESEASDVVHKLKSLLKEAEKSSKISRKQSLDLATLNALGLQLGDTVTVAGKVGVLRFCGSTEFASGQWAGIELSEPFGKNDGSVSGIRYFTCRPRHGIFAPLSRVTKYVPKKISRTVTSGSPVGNNGSSSTFPQEKIPENPRYQVGDLVLVAKQKRGIVRFTGETKFAQGFWVGVELEQAAGKNDGSVAGVRYFTCEQNHGIFAPFSKVERIDHDRKETPSKESSPLVSASTTTGIVNRSGQTSPDSGRSSTSSLLSRNSQPSPERKFKSKLPTRVDQKHSPTNADTERERKPHTPVSTTTDSDRIHHGGEKSQSRFSRSRSPSRSSSSPDFRLKEGMSVYVNSELGIVRYIGLVDFAEGVWLGVELRKPSGKNDGCVGNRRYFSWSVTSYLRKNEAEKLQNGSVYLAQIPDPMFLTLGWDISRTTWRIKQTKFWSDGTTKQSQLQRNQLFSAYKGKLMRSVHQSLYSALQQIMADCCRRPIESKQSEVSSQIW